MSLVVVKPNDAQTLAVCSEKIEPPPETDDAVSPTTVDHALCCGQGEQAESLKSVDLSMDLDVSEQRNGAAPVSVHQGYRFLFIFLILIIFLVITTVIFMIT